ncbi:MAG: hypothetical protein NXI10_15500 [bacterium]|nr:hypothetical protein [bacterium]
MKSCFTILVSLVLLLLSLSACNEEVDVIGDFKETAVVYGLLDQADSVHFIKITRAFVGPGNALEISKIPDSNYFENIHVVITEELANGSAGRSWTLFDTLVDTKETNGIFYAPEQKVYAFYSRSKDDSGNPNYEPLNAQATYHLHITIDAGTSSAFEVFGSTQIVSGISTSTDAPHFQFKFAEDNNITGEYRPTIMYVNTGNAKVVNASLLIDIQNYTNTDSFTNQIKWKWGEIPIDNGGPVVFNGKGESFYQLINQACEGEVLDVMRRNIEGLTVKITGGSEDLYTYILVNKPNSSITQNKPEFTNLTATNDHPAIGLFSSRYTHTVHHPMVNTNQSFRCIDRISTMELCMGPITGAHSFCSQQPLDIVQGESWACN